MSIVFTTAQLRSVRAAARKILRDGPKDPDYGICRNVSVAAGWATEWEAGGTPNRITAYNAVGEASRTWSLSTGNSSYPVPDVAGLKWEGKNGELRRCLLRHLIAWCSRELARGAGRPQWEVPGVWPVTSLRSLRRYAAAGAMFRDSEGYGYTKAEARARVSKGHPTLARIC